MMYICVYRQQERLVKLELLRTTITNAITTSSTIIQSLQLSNIQKQ